MNTPSKPPARPRLPIRPPPPSTPASPRTRPSSETSISTRPEPRPSLRFRPGQTVLSKQAKDALDDLAAQVKSQRGYIIEVQGFSSGQGQAAIANSQKMADSVERYLVLNHQIPAYRIFVIGMGNVTDAQRASGSRIEVSLMRNDLDQVPKP